MPNWVENVLSVRGEASEIEKLRFAVTGEQSEFDFNAIKPYPAEYAEADRRYREWEESVINPDLSMRPKDGFNNGGYEWRCKNWGTKWNANLCSVVETSDGIQYWFMTAWDPPIPIIQTLSITLPSLIFTLEYAESGNDFSGLYEAQAGKVRKDWAGKYTPAVWEPSVDIGEYEKQFEDELPEGDETLH